MRRAVQDTGWYLAEDGTLLGITLGFGYCAEHECGVRDLKAAFGVTAEPPIGLEDRRITRVPESFGFRRTQRKPKDKRRKPYEMALLSTDGWLLAHLHEPACPSPVRFLSEPGDRWYKPAHDLAAAWSWGSFAIAARGKENIARLEELYQAFCNHDIVFGSVIAQFIRRQGLTFMIDSRIPQETRNQVREADLDHKRLIDTAKATGIEERLRAAGRGWFALHPLWTDASKQTVKFWLNPVEQHRYNAGYYTVEELDQWARDEGPVMRARERAQG